MPAPSVCVIDQFNRARRAMLTSFPWGGKFLQTEDFLFRIAKAERHIDPKIRVAPIGV